jgi:DNA-binding response OmpR family regulator
MRLLFVEDSQRLQRYVGTGLRRAGHAVDITGTGSDGLWRARSSTYDVIVLDIMLPGMDGLSVLRELRTGGCEAHVLLLTARDAVEDRINGLRMGADDYLVKPFVFDELLARIEALGRRAIGRKAPVLIVGDLEVNAATQTVQRGSRKIDLLPREFALLSYLASRVSEVVSRAEIESHIYDDRVEPMSNVVDSAICSLRRKIDNPGEPSLIVTRRRVGYVLMPEPPKE